MSDKKWTNLQIAELLRDVAAAYQLQDSHSNKFKIIAYERAADAVEHASSELKDIWDEGELENVAGIGPSIAKHLDELFTTGHSKHFDELLSPLPKSMFKLMEVPGIGPKTAYRLSQEFNISDKSPIEDLKEIAKQGKIAKLEGFGEDSQAEILKSLNEYKGKSTRFLLPYAMSIADEIIKYMLVESSVKKIDPLGSLRRKVSTIGDIDFAVATDDPKKVIEHFVNYPNKSRVLEKGERSATILLASGVHVDLLVHDPNTYGATLQHFTGSKHHNVALRDLALKKGLSLSDYGIKALKSTQKKNLAKFNFDRKLEVYQIPTEEEFYKVLGMDWIPSELREDTGEIDAAISHNIPDLLELKDIKSDLQIHSNFDIETSHDLGESSMEEVLEAAEKLGYAYVAFTEHNPSRSKHSQLQIIDILKRKREKVDKINSVKRRVKAFNSLEIDMMTDGNLPVPQKGLETLDFALVSIHSQFKLSKIEQTMRVLKALSYPKVKIFAHPTGRKLNNREGAELDWQQIFETVLKNNQWVEINCDPMRLDLPDMLVREAVKRGVKLTLGTDSHHKDSLKNMPFGVWVARRGWATKNDIINSRNLNEFEKLLN